MIAPSTKISKKAKQIKANQSKSKQIKANQSKSKQIKANQNKINGREVIIDCLLFDVVRVHACATSVRAERQTAGFYTSSLICPRRWS